MVGTLGKASVMCQPSKPGWWRPPRANGRILGGGINSVSTKGHTLHAHWPAGWMNGTFHTRIPTLPPRAPGKKPPTRCTGSRVAAVASTLVLRLRPDSKKTTTTAPIFTVYSLRWGCRYGVEAEGSDRRVRVGVNDEKFVWAFTACSAEVRA
eukprot:285786-Chlamydomonas_euryale.AAC.4